MFSNGTLMVSLDFELYWGVHDVMSIEKYRENLLGVRKAIPAILDLFVQYDIHATWATVGMLFFENKSELTQSLPVLKPNYNQPSLSPYRLLIDIGENEGDDPFHFASSLIKTIASCSYQEIGTHTFAHYYCLEKGQTIEEFKDDLKSAVKTGKNRGYQIKSIVFPRNQVNHEYINICKDFGIRAFRGNEDSFIYNPSNFEKNQSAFKRVLRLADSYINITGHHIYSPEQIQIEPIINFPSSRFLRPYHTKTKLLEGLRLNRIKKSLTKAAKDKKLYHLWWHPHNFGKNLEENLSFLKNILEHYESLKRKYGMESLNMEEAAEQISRNRTHWRKEA